MKIITIEEKRLLQEYTEFLRSDKCVTLFSPASKLVGAFTDHLKNPPPPTPIELAKNLMEKVGPVEALETIQTSLQTSNHNKPDTRAYDLWNTEHSRLTLIRDYIKGSAEFKSL